MYPSACAQCAMPGRHGRCRFPLTALSSWRSSHHVFSAQRFAVSFALLRFDSRAGGAAKKTGSALHFRFLSQHHAPVFSTDETVRIGISSDD
jgi:hypothetical protein